MKFNYSGTTKGGERVRGSLDAVDEIEAKMRLRAMQVRPDSLTKGGEVGGGFLSSLLGGGSKAGGGKKSVLDISFGSPVPLKAMIVFTRQFSSLIDSGVAIVQCLDILCQQERNKIFKAILGQIKEDIESGNGLADSLQKHPKVFSEFFIRIVEAGEVSGTLDKALRRVGVQLEKLGRLKSKVIGALLYPTITMVVAFFVLLFLLLVVIPKVAELYTQSKAALPELTQTVMNLSEWVQHNWVMLFGGTIATVVTLVVAYRQPKVRSVWDPFFLKVPLFGSLVKKAAIARFTRTLSTLLQSGVPLLTAFEICVKLVGNLAIKDVIRRAASAVTEGKSIASGLGESTIFPPMVIHMVSIGEMTGRLDELMGKVADIFDDEVDEAIGALTGLLQPVMIVGIGIMIAFLLLAMYLPIFQMGDKVAGS